MAGVKAIGEAVELLAFQVAIELDRHLDLVELTNVAQIGAVANGDAVLRNVFLDKRLASARGHLLQKPCYLAYVGLVEVTRIGTHVVVLQIGDQHSGRVRLGGDLGQQLAGGPRVVVADRESLRVLEEVASEVEHDALMELRVHVFVEDGHRVADDCEEEACERGDYQQVGSVGPEQMRDETGRPTSLA